MSSSSYVFSYVISKDAPCVPHNFLGFSPSLRPTSTDVERLRPPWIPGPPVTAENPTKLLLGHPRLEEKSQLNSLVMWSKRCFLDLVPQFPDQKKVNLFGFSFFSRETNPQKRLMVIY